MQHTRTLRLIPVADFFRYSSPIIPLYYLVGNIILFVPLGWVLRQRTTHAIRFGSGVSLGIELTQYAFALGFTDLNDVLHNALGAWLAPHLRPIIIAFFAVLGIYAVVGG